MVTAIGSTLADAAKALATPPDKCKVESLDAIGAFLNKHGFERMVAGITDFSRVCRAFQESQKQHKGICFTGSCGVGKTVAMRCFYEGVKSTEKEWIDCNDPNALGWLTQPYLEFMHIFLDDFGGERMAYGDQDLVGAFIIKWHMHHDPRRLMCITTNLTGEKIDERYGNRVFDRIKELCIICPLSGDSKREVTVIK